MLTNEQIFKKAIEKAVGNGWKGYDGKQDVLLLDTGYMFNKDWEFKYETLADEPESLIFSHSFAKAFWGGEPCFCHGDTGSHILDWQYHLQQMVLEEEPLLYIERFL